MNSQRSDQKRGDVKEAERLMERDVPNSEEAPQEGSHTQKPKPYRPDENVDGQKSHSTSPAHNTSMKNAPFSGAQVVKEKKAHKENIDQESDKADPKSSE
ncbi:hypothetical protein [Vreelandella sp. EE7]